MAANGLLAALPRVFPGIAVQRCWAHQMRNILDKVRKADQPAAKRGLHKVMNADHENKSQGVSTPFLLTQNF